MRFWKDFNVDFTVWLLQELGVQYTPFDLHPAKPPESFLANFLSDCWLEWLDFVLDIQDKEVTRLIPSNLLPPNFLPTPKNPYPVVSRKMLPFDFWENDAEAYQEVSQFYYRKFPGAKVSYRVHYKMFDFLAESEIPKNNVDLLFVEYPEFVWCKSKRHRAVVVSMPITSQEEQRERLFEIARRL